MLGAFLGPQARKMPPRPGRTTRTPPADFVDPGSFPCGLRLFSASVQSLKRFLSKKSVVQLSPITRRVSLSVGSFASLMFGPKLRHIQERRKDSRVLESSSANARDRRRAAGHGPSIGQLTFICCEAPCILQVRQ